MSTSWTTSRLWPRFQRHPAIALRRERWGGFAYHRGQGDLLELDQQGFEVLAALGRETDLRELRFVLSYAERPSRVPQLAQFVSELEQRGFVQQTSKVEVRPRFRSPLRLDSMQSTQRRFMSDSRDLSAPLVAHWAVTYRCNLACSFCYAEGSPDREREPVQEIRTRIVRKLAELGVFEVALGGGEPTVLSDFSELLAAIRRHGMVPNVTTNGLLNSAKVLQALAEYVGTVHLSADRSDLLDAARGDGVSARIDETIHRLSALDVRWGVNLLLTPTTLSLSIDPLSSCKTWGRLPSRCCARKGSGPPGLGLAFPHRETCARLPRP